MLLYTTLPYTPHLHSRSLFGTKGTFTSFFSRSGYAPPASPGGEASIHGGAAGGFKQVEAKYPALLFKQQLDAFVQKIFPMLRDNVKKEITPQLAACIHAPKSSHRSAARPRPGEAPGMCVGGAHGGGWSVGCVPHPTLQALGLYVWLLLSWLCTLLTTLCCSLSCTDVFCVAHSFPMPLFTPPQKNNTHTHTHTHTHTVVTQLSPHWGHILSVFDALLDTLRRNHVPPFLVRKLFQQLFSFVNVQLFNQLLLRRECCSFSNGEYVKTGLAEVEMWIAKAGTDWVGESWEELKYIRQVCYLMVV